MSKILVNINYSNKTKIINYGYYPTKNSLYTATSIAIPFDCAPGQDFFNNSEYKSVFFKLAPHYSPQQHITTCGISSAIIILNTIFANNHVVRPIALNSSLYIKEHDTLYANFIWTEDNFFNDNVKDVLNIGIVTGSKKINDDYCPGVTLAILTKSLNLQGVIASCFHIDKNKASELDSFRELIKSM